MSARPSLVYSAVLLISSLLSPAPSMGQATPQYEVYVIEYGFVPDQRLSDYLPGADPSLRADMSLMVWLIKGPDGHNILVDSGYRPDFTNNTTPLVEGYLRPDLAVGKLGIDPNEISDIILTHIHWDHADGLPLFPSAHVWLQKAELKYYGERARQQSIEDAAPEPRFIRDLVDLHAAGRVTLVDGDDQEIFPGIRVYTGPKHTFASQYVGVNTSGGTVIVASDCIWFYANLELGLANRITLDAEADLVAFERMKSRASNPVWILPGHDRSVFGKFPNPIQGVARVR